MIPPFGSLTSHDAMTRRFCPDCRAELLPGDIHNCDDQDQEDTP